MHIEIDCQLFPDGHIMRLVRAHLNLDAFTDDKGQAGIVPRIPVGLGESLRHLRIRAGLALIAVKHPIVIQIVVGPVGNAKIDIRIQRT